jgi:hypothetical protein
VNVENIFVNETDFVLESIDFVRIPMLKWSARSNLTHLTKVKNLVVVGSCIHKLKEKSFVMIFNMKDEKAELVKILDTHCEVSAVAWGPFDNGHVLLGLADGQLLAYDFPSLQLVERTQVF